MLNTERTESAQALFNAQQDADAARDDAEAAAADRADALAAIIKLKGVVEDIRVEMVDAQQSAER